MCKQAMFIPSKNEYDCTDTISQCYVFHANLRIVKFKHLNIQTESENFPNSKATDDDSRQKKLS